MKEKIETFQSEAEPKNAVAAERFSSYEVYREQLDKGARIYGEISGIPQEDKRVKKAHPELLLFFSFIKPEPSTQFRRLSNSPTLTEYGLKVGNRLYEYELPLQQQILRLKGERALRNTGDGWVLTRELSEKRGAFQSKYASECEQWFNKQLNQEYNQKIQEAKRKIDSPYLQNTVQRFGARILCEQFSTLTESRAEDLFKLAYRYSAADRNVQLKKESLKKARDNKESEAHINTIEFELSNAREDASAKRVKYQEALKKEKIEHLDISSLIDEAEEGYRTAKESFILKHNYVTEEELSKLKKHKATVLSGEALIDSSEIKVQQRAKNAVEGADDLRKAMMGIRAKNAVRRAYIDLRSAVRWEMGAEYAGEHFRERDYPELIKVFYKREPIGLFDDNGHKNLRNLHATVQEARERLEEKLIEVYGAPDPFSNIDKTIELEREYLGIKEKYHRGEIKFGPTPPHVRQEFLRVRQGLREEREEKYYQEAVERMRDAAKNIEKKVSSLVLGRNDIDDAVFTPTGCFVTYGNGGVGAFAISPFDPRIEASLEPHEAEAWRNTWNFLRKQSIDGANEGKMLGLASCLNEEFERLTNACIQSVPNETLNRSRELCRKYHISTPKLFAPNSSMNRLPSARDLDSLEEIMPYISKLVNTVDLEHAKLDGYHNMNLDGIVETLKFALSGRAAQAPAINARLSDLVWVDGKKVTFNLTLYKAILHDTGDNQKMARQVFCSCLGSELFEKIGNDAIKHFEEALGMPVNITSQAIYRLFRVRVISSLERRKIATKLMFINELEKYASGESDPKMHSFFKSLDVFKD